MNKTLVLKCGGSTLEELSPQFFKNFNILRKNGWQIVIVHGGGPAIQQMLEKMNLSFKFIDGLRQTTEEMIDIIEMVLSGQINSQLTRYINAFGLPAIGLAGTDNQLLTAQPVDKKKYGLVGEVIRVNTSFLKQLLKKNIVPIISPIAVDEQQNRYNINADTAAGAIACALNANRLIFVTDVPGILKDGKPLGEIYLSDLKQMIQSGDIYGGMLPKIRAAMQSLSTSVSKVMIVNGKQSTLTKHNFLQGTTI